MSIFVCFLLAFLISTAFSSALLSIRSEQRTEASGTKHFLRSLGWVLAMTGVVWLVVYLLAYNHSWLHLSSLEQITKFPWWFTWELSFSLFAGTVCGISFSVIRVLKEMAIFADGVEPQKWPRAALAFSSLSLIAMLFAVMILSIPDERLTTLIGRIASIPTPIGELRFNGETKNDPITANLATLNTIPGKTVEKVSSLSELASLNSALLMDPSMVAGNRILLAHPVREGNPNFLKVGKVPYDTVFSFKFDLAPLVKCLQAIYIEEDDKSFLNRSLNPVIEAMRGAIWESRTPRGSSNEIVKQLRKQLIRTMIRVRERSNDMGLQSECNRLEQRMGRLEQTSSLKLQCESTHSRRCTIDDETLDNFLNNSDFLKHVADADFDRRPYATQLLANLLDASGQERNAIIHLDNWLRRHHQATVPVSEASIPYRRGVLLIRRYLVALLIADVRVKNRSRRYKHMVLSEVSRQISAIEELFTPSQIRTAYHARKCSQPFDDIDTIDHTKTENRIEKLDDILRKLLEEREDRFTALRRGKIPSRYIENRIKVLEKRAVKQFEIQKRDAGSRIGLVDSERIQYLRMHLYALNNYVDLASSIPASRLADAPRVWRYMKMLDAYTITCLKSRRNIKELTSSELNVSETLGRLKLFWVRNFSSITPAGISRSELLSEAKMLFRFCLDNSAATHNRLDQFVVNQDNRILHRIFSAPQGVSEECERGLQQVLALEG